jgi:hypothetical protein
MLRKMTEWFGMANNGKWQQAEKRQQDLDIIGRARRKFQKRSADDEEMLRMTDEE